MVNRTISVSLPEPLIALIDETRERRQDPTRSDTVRALLLQALADLSLLPEDSKKALGLIKGAERER